MTDLEIAQATALARCSFSPGSTAKRFVAWAEHRATQGVAYTMTPKASAFLDKLAHQYREQLGRCMSTSCTKCRPAIDLSEVTIAMDAIADNRADYGELHADDIIAWRKAALALYNTTHGTTFAHPYEYATKVAANNRRAHTLGDIYCRFCGEQIFAQVKQPHKLVASSAMATKHLTLCALQSLAKLRETERPGYRKLPMQELWQL